MRRTDARDRILRAAVLTLGKEGYAGTTARAIALTGGFAPGVIYYHFADLDDLFRETMRFTSSDRLERYRAETTGMSSAVELLARLRVLHDEDVSGGHIAAVQELVAAGSAHVVEQIAVETRRWLDLAEEIIGGLVAETPFAAFVPVRQAAEAVVAFYLGIEMIGQIDPELARPESFFDGAEQAAVFFDALRQM